MASGSQVWSGIWADFATAPTRRKKPDQLESAGADGMPWDGFARRASKPRLPTAPRATKEAITIPTSPMTFITKALRAAATAARSLPEADQQVAGQAHQGPADDQDDEVVGQHQQQHREDEEVHVGEEARVVVVGLVLHVADGVDVDEEADAGDDQGHHRGQRVEVEVDVDGRHRKAGPAAVACRGPIQW